MLSAIMLPKKRRGSNYLLKKPSPRHSADSVFDVDIMIVYVKMKVDGNFVFNGMDNCNYSEWLEYEY